MIKLLATVSFVLAVQACTTSGGAPSGASALDYTASGPRDASGLHSTGTLSTAVVGIPADPGPQRAFRIGPDDKLKIEVFEVAELSSDVTVSEDGFIVMPLIGSVKVAGLTPEEAAKLIASKLNERYLDNPQVSVLVTESSRQRVAVTGQVRSPGVFTLPGKTSLMQLIAMAGGLDDVAKKDEVIIFRKQDDDKFNAYVVNFDAVQKGELTDPVIVGDDRIMVPRSGTKVLARTIENALLGVVRIGTVAY
jgi:polysaccharide export outer membrane protein